MHPETSTEFMTLRQEREKGAISYLNAKSLRELLATFQVAVGARISVGRVPGVALVPRFTPG